MKPTFALLALGFLLSACAGSSSLSRVTVYNSQDEVPGEYSILGVVQSDEGIQSTGYSTKGTQLKRARITALQMGANGLLLVSEDSPAIDGQIRLAIENAQRGANTNSTSVNRTVMLAIVVHEDDSSGG